MQNHISTEYEFSPGYHVYIHKAFLKNYIPKRNTETIFPFGRRGGDSQLFFNDVDLFIVFRKFQKFNFRGKNATLL